MLLHFSKALKSFRLPNHRCLSAVPSWEKPLADEDFGFLRNVLAAPSPVGLEGAMTHGVLQERFKSFAPSHWKSHSFKGNAGVVWDSAPNQSGKEKPLTVMIMGHADKIRCQVRSVAADGKVYINSDSFLPFTLIGNEVLLFSEETPASGKYKKISGTVEAIGAIHFAPSAARTGQKGIAPEKLYLELGLSGTKSERKKQVDALGIRPGDTIIMDRPVKKCPADASNMTFSGAYLDNGLGCFVAAEVAKKLVERGDDEVFQHVRLLSAFAAYEEIGRFGSRVMVSDFEPDVLIAVDVNHDYDSAPDRGSQRDPPLRLGSGFTLCVGSVASESLNTLIEKSASENNIPMQRDMRGRDTGTDAMAGVLGNTDCAATSVGFCIRNMHTISELGHLGDVTSCIEGLYETIKHMARNKVTGESFRDMHPRLDNSERLIPKILEKETEK
eukprot:g4357.t1